MKTKYVYICVSHKEAPNDVIVFKSNQTDITPGYIVRDLFNDDLPGTNWLPFVVNSLNSIPNVNIIAFTDCRSEFFDIIRQQIKKQL